MIPQRPCGMTRILPTILHSRKNSPAEVSVLVRGGSLTCLIQRALTLGKSLFIEHLICLYLNINVKICIVTTCGCRLQTNNNKKEISKMTFMKSMGEKNDLYHWKQENDKIYSSWNELSKTNTLICPWVKAPYDMVDISLTSSSKSFLASLYLSSMSPRFPSEQECGMHDWNHQQHGHKLCQLKPPLKIMNYLKITAKCWIQTETVRNLRDLEQIWSHTL